LTTPEEAQAFLASMRDKSHEREYLHQHSITVDDGMDSWYLQQRKRERELRQRRAEAELILRSYRGGRQSLGSTNGGNRGNGGRDGHAGLSMIGEIGALTTEQSEFPTGMSIIRQTSSTHSECLDDPRTFKHHVSAFGNSAGRVSVADSHSDEEERTTSTKSNNHKEAPPPPDNAEPTVWLDFISSLPGARFPPASGRYHLYLSYACPGSHRVLIVRALKGLEDVISVTYVHPTWRLTNPDDADDKHRGWVFGDPDGEPFANTINRGGPFPAAYPGNTPDPHFGAFSIRDIYQRAGDTSGKYTIPLLWDTVEGTIVNNESSDIAYMLNSCFNDFSTKPELDLYTEYDQEGVAKLNEVSDWLSPLMIHGVYRCGFAKNQRAYDKAIAELCAAFDRADDTLQSQRYLTGNDVITDADIRLFVSLVRFDEVYAVYFRANARLVMLTPSLLNFCREIYQMPGVADTCHMDQIKAHFYGSHCEWNKYGVIPRGLGFMELLDMPHDRCHNVRTADDTAANAENTAAADPQ
jgi:glutathionyl-hydroquinone reductase